MRQHRGHWNRGTWTKKTNTVEAAETSLLLKISPTLNAVKNGSPTWTDTAHVDDSASSWDAQIYDASFFDDNKRIFEWDDSGALDSLKTAENNLQQGFSLVYEDYLNELDQFSASVDWDTRWSCTLPDCAEEFPCRDERKKNPKGSSSRKDLPDSASAVILGLPEAKDEAGCSGTPSLHLPLHFVPEPTGWDESEAAPVEQSRWEDSPMQPVGATNVEDGSLEPSSQGWWQDPTNVNDGNVVNEGIGWPEYPNSYQHIIPSGWGDVQADPPVVPSGWGDLDEEPRADVQMQQADFGWGDFDSQEPNSSRSGWGNLHPSVESHQVYGKSHSGKQQDFYNKSFKYGYWKPKRGSDTNNYETSGRKSMQRPGRSISTVYRVNHDPRSPRINRLDRSKPQWPSAGALTHGTEPALGDSLPGGAIFLDEGHRRYHGYYY